MPKADVNMLTVYHSLKVEVRTILRTLMDIGFMHDFTFQHKCAIEVDGLSAALTWLSVLPTFCKNSVSSFKFEAIEAT